MDDCIKLSMIDKLQRKYHDFTVMQALDKINMYEMILSCIQTCKLSQIKHKEHYKIKFQIENKKD
jgi:hypothetical protein